ncbi:hypothetical protein CONPUDRAFT_170229 [Coniophora puteana RWD-64-598 SS2]|uniref:Uncharacterized protein n=1 Tax=Coniophora puteana (strain RWD-64-598) TaxID=741705 RepID=R7SEF1_CONPW|nr:uncharacterized protein CONPUDRAFT_170229 [Coniophora puteana RWD-64-598 SS2]EIW74205.1 hypothetical protein CONPUDRAFT_170229 [Coniophora puteana RWD-64-598 SS2]
MSSPQSHEISPQRSSSPTTSLDLEAFSYVSGLSTRTSEPSSASIELGEDMPKDLTVRCSPTTAQIGTSRSRTLADNLSHPFILVTRSESFSLCDAGSFSPGLPSVGIPTPPTRYSSTRRKILSPATLGGDLDGPAPPKRIKTSHPALGTKGPASLRKARSLMAQASLEKENESFRSLYCGPTMPRPADFAVCAPTSVPDLRPHAITVASEPIPADRFQNGISALGGPTILVPSLYYPCGDYAFQPVLSEEDCAGLRIQRLLEKEDTDFRAPESTSMITDDRLWDRALGIPSELRTKAIRWLLDVLPDVLLPHEDDLHDQLSTSPETRFCAARMLLRYLYCAVGAGSCGGFDDARGNYRPYDHSSGTCDDDMIDMVAGKALLIDEGLESLIWDVTLACLALSVKLHRDVMPPLEPVCMSDFRALLRYKVSLDDFETAQRDVLSALDYRLGTVTPQSYLDELWIASASLRGAVGTTEMWANVQKEVWDMLFDALLGTEVDVLRYCLSVLTGAALLDGLVVALARKYKAEAGKAISGSRHRGDQVTMEVWQEHVRRAICEIRGVDLDIQDLLDVSKDDLEDCRTWLGRAVSQAG